MADMYKQIDKKTLKELHKVEKEILDAVVKVCEKNNLNYILSGGTLLGAIRHKGFIPWDDDIDIAMPREDYEKFLEIGQKEIGDKFYIQSDRVEDDYWLGFAKVRKNGTTFANTWSINSTTHNGVFIDIFPLDYVKDKDSKVLNLKATLVHNFIDTLIYKKGYHKTLSECRHPVLVTLMLPFGTKKIHKIMHKLMTAENDSKDYVISFVGAYHYKKDIFPYDKVFPLSKVEFEGTTYTTFNDTDFYLKQLYGKYMELPSEDKRLNHAPDVIDFENGYEPKK